MIIGYLGGDPDVRYLPNGDPVANFSVATNTRWKDRESGEQKERTEWHRCSAFGRQAEVIAEYLRKGSHVFVEGELQTRKWQDKDGIDRWTTEIRVRGFEFLDRKGEGGGGRPPHSADMPPDDREKTRTSTPSQSSQEPPPEFDDDIPF